MSSGSEDLIRFDKFMEFALHDPEHGYYAKHINTVGRTGDFSTSASLSNSLAKAISNWIRKESKIHQFKQIHVVEVGAGSGKLMHDIMQQLSYLFRRRCHFHIVETSDPLVEVQQKKLSKNVNWHKSLADCLTQTKGEAVIYSNELIDAFPVRVFKFQENKWSELYVHKKSRSEVFQSNSNPNNSAANTATNQRIEVHNSYKEWLETNLSSLNKGSMLTIDYGDKYPSLYHKKPHGTLRAYSHHTALTGLAVYQNIGHQDITCDVNFTDIISWSEQLGLVTVDFVSQSKFIQSSHIVDQFLTDKNGAGTAFKVLKQRKV